MSVDSEDKSSGDTERRTGISPRISLLGALVFFLAAAFFVLISLVARDSQGQRTWALSPLGVIGGLMMLRLFYIEQKKRD